MKRAAWGIGSLLVLAGLDWVIPQFFNAYVRQVVILCGINAILAVSLNLINGFTGQFSIGHAGFMAIGGYGSAMITLHAGRYLAAGLAATGIPAGLAQAGPLVLAPPRGGALAPPAGFPVGPPRP